MSLADWDINEKFHAYPGYLTHAVCKYGYAIRLSGVWKCCECRQPIPIEMLQVATLVGALDNGHRRIHYGA